MMASFYLEKHTCQTCLGARRLGGEPCEGCGGTGYEQVKPYPVEPAEYARCPDCKVERADYEGPNGAWLPKCPNCHGSADPVLTT